MLFIIIVDVKSFEEIKLRITDTFVHGNLLNQTKLFQSFILSTDGC